MLLDVSVNGWMDGWMCKMLFVPLCPQRRERTLLDVPVHLYILYTRIAVRDGETVRPVPVTWFWWVLSSGFCVLCLWSMRRYIPFRSRNSWLVQDIDLVCVLTHTSRSTNFRSLYQYQQLMLVLWPKCETTIFYWMLNAECWMPKCRCRWFKFLSGYRRNR